MCVCVCMYVGFLGKVARRWDYGLVVYMGLEGRGLFIVHDILLTLLRALLCSTSMLRYV